MGRKIKTPCPKCGKKNMIKSVFSLTRDFLEIRVLNRCYKCKFNPRQRYIRKNLRPSRSVIHQVT
jgi:uncharacterized Zn finger protein